jgi:hypothetical protein
MAAQEDANAMLNNTLRPLRLRRTSGYIICTSFGGNNLQEIEIWHQFVMFFAVGHVAEKFVMRRFRAH